MLIFFASKKSCETAGAALRNEFGSNTIDILHSEMDEAQRQAVVDRLLACETSNESYVICCTSVQCHNHHH